MKIWKIVILLVVLVAVVYAVLFFITQKKLLEDTCYYFRGFKIKSFMGGKAVIEVKLGIKNKSKVKLDILSQSYKIYINDKLLSKVKNTNQFTLLSGQEIATPFTLEFNPIDILNVGVVQLLANPSGFVLRLKGTATAGLGILVFNRIPIDISFTLKEMMSSGGASTC